LGNLDVERVKWPKSSKVTGADVDILARRHLWEAQKDYCHGTGHGVGYFLGVHEGPVGISKYNQTVFEPNMIVTNEPGYYETGKYGIRIENILVVNQ
jgi:Xaa-Pro aminopeptidase